MTLILSKNDSAMLAGEQGRGKQFAMRIVSQMAKAMGATSLVDISSAHIDGCLYNGQASVDFVKHAVEIGAEVSVPTTLNVGTLDLIHPELFRGEEKVAEAGKFIMESYQKLGCKPSFTCAPYQLPKRPEFGEHIAWAESNAIVFANSVLGARTNRYGDFIDLCAAISGRVPYSGFHTDEGRRAQHVFKLKGFSDELLTQETLFTAVGLFVGRKTESRIPVIVGLPSDASEDALRALGAASATSGSVGLFHAVGITPEAVTLDDALQHQDAEIVEIIKPDDLRQVLKNLSTATNKETLSAICLGTPHFSIHEFEALMTILENYSGRVEMEFYINTGRHVLAQLEERGHVKELEGRGIQLVIDTCTYITPILKNLDGVVMTNSGKWAYYAPGNIGVQVAFGSLEDCVKSAYLGEVSQDDRIWS